MYKPYTPLQCSLNRPPSSYKYIISATSQHLATGRAASGVRKVTCKKLKSCSTTKSMDNIKPYFRASRKQLDYLAFLCNELGIMNRSLYEPYTMIRASKEINRLRRRIEKQKVISQQVVLL
jgi:hypothetical protein